MKNKQLLLFSLVMAVLAVGCTATSVDTSLNSVSSSNATAAASSTTSGTITVTTATLNSATGCIANVNTVVSSDLPSWATDNFKCQVAYVSSTNYIFKSANWPNHKSFYYCSAHTAAATSCNTGTANPNLYEGFSGGNYAAGTNVLSQQSFVYTIPASPSLKSGSLSSTQGGLASIGITANGMAIFNNAAAPPDTLSTEAATFDQYNMHPTNVGIGHHHAAVTKLSTSMTDSTLLGVALDGYLIYAEKCDNGTSSTSDDYTPTAPSSTSNGQSTGLTGGTSTQLDQLHGHTTTTRHLTTATYHYHYAQDPTAGIKTIMGSYFRGTIGSVSN